MREILDLLRPPSVEVRMARELDQARRALLDAQTAREYAHAIVEYNERRIDRLRSQIDHASANANREVS